MLILFSFFVAAAFGTITDNEGNEVKPTSTNDYGGSVYSLPEQKLKVDYNGNSVDYSGLSGDVVFSDDGKLVEGEVDVKSAGKYIFGNVKLDLKSGAKVIFKNGELKIEDPGQMYDKDDLSFVDNDLGWDNTEVKLSGDGVDLHGLSDVGLDEYGYYLDSPKDFEYDDFIVTAEGRVYIDESGDGGTHPEYPGNYISVNGNSKKFTIGSNKYDESIAVKVKSDNKYDLTHDVTTDHIALKSRGGASPSYISVQGRSQEYLTPKIDTAGYFAIDDNRHGSYLGPDNKIYTMYEGTGVIPEFPVGSGSTPTPVQIDFYNYEGGNLVRMSDYGGSLVIGNDGAVGYGDPSYTVAGRYDGSELMQGASNLLAYNYYKGGKDTIEQLFGFPITGGRANVVDDPREGKWFMDLLFQTPEPYRKNIRSVRLDTSIQWGALGICWSSGDVAFAVPRGWSHRTIAHEFAHVFDFTIGRHDDNSEFARLWNGIGGDRLTNLKGSYTSSWEEKVSTFIEQQYRPLDSYWQANYNGDVGVQKRVAAAILGQGITFYNGRKILQAIGAGPINSLEDVKKVYSG